MENDELGSVAVTSTRFLKNMMRAGELNGTGPLGSGIH